MRRVRAEVQGGEVDREVLRADVPAAGSEVGAVSELLTPRADAGSSKLLTPEELAERLGMTKDWVYARSREWVKSNGQRGIPTVRLGRFYRYRSDAIARWEAQVEQGEAEA